MSSRVYFTATDATLLDCLTGRASAGQKASTNNKLGGRAMLLVAVPQTSMCGY
jgi:hypothetical protein